MGGFYHHEEDYTDYSCSTAIERLSRDVETVLRAWHVDEGSDRHVPVKRSHRSSTPSTAKHHKTTMGTLEDPSSPLIRSNTLIWHIPVTTSRGRTTVTVDLELALWDAPPSALGKQGGPTDHEDPEEPDHPLVKSLRRTPFGKMATHEFLFDNFSRLFGIGQHISLSPIQPHPIPVDLSNLVGGSVLERHEDSSTAPWIFGSTISGWLQTALNCAAANCHCGIPVFGIWGVYRPNELRVERPAGSKKKQQRNNAMNGGTTVGSQKTPYSHATSSVLSHGSIPNTLSMTSAGDRSDMLLGTTIQTKDSQGAPIDGPQSSSTIQIDAYDSKPATIQLFPQWAQAMHAATLPQVPHQQKQQATRTYWNQQYVPPVICGSVSSTCAPINAPSTAATMWVSAIKNPNAGAGGAVHHSLSQKSSRLTMWGSVLLQHCPGESSCILSGARHVFGWFKPDASAAPRTPGLFRNARAEYLASLQEWRENTLIQLDDGAALDEDEEQEVGNYRKHCHAHALDLLDDAWGYKDKDTPMWGPMEDPVSCIHVTTTWSGKASGNSETEEPLLSLPLRIRSRRELSKRDWHDMEESVERTLLDPVQPSRFIVQVHFDRDMAVNTVSANQRCILASLIRSATLPGETLLQHLTDIALVGLWDDNAGTIVANKLAEKARVGKGTCQIVDAMDWTSVMDDMITLTEAEEIVHQVMSGELTSKFPTSPDDAFLDNDDLAAPFPKAAPFGRLLSVMFAHMAKIRSLSSMALVWGVFVQELRRRWEARESLPNMAYVPGLDPHPLELHKGRRFSSIGHKADFAAYLNSCEPDPDDYHCLIGQKLQVFNIGVECIVAGELLEDEVMERFLVQGRVPASATLPDMEGSNTSDIPSEEPSEVEPAGRRPSAEYRRQSNSKRKWPRAKSRPMFAPAAQGEREDYGPPAINSDLEFWVMDEPGFAPRDEGADFVAPPTDDDTGFDYVAPPPAHLDDLDVEDSVAEGASRARSKRRSVVVIDGLPTEATWEGAIMESNEEEDEDEEEDDESEGSVDSNTTAASQSQQFFDAAEAGSIFSMRYGFFSMDTIVNVADLNRRPGARCPVQGITIKSTGDQLYAPYLHRPYPLTDDLVLERRHMLANARRSGEKRKSILQSRIDLAHRLQEPKLRSDMCSFKAANPSATIDDFAKWYGNPGSPLDDYDEDPLPDDESISDAVYDSAAKKLDRASVAMKVLTATRNFWSDMWQKAAPIAASEQKPLFDFSSTVEMAVDYLEQMHPANLLNQVMAVNLSSAYFTLVSSAEDALKIRLVEVSVKKLRAKIGKALKLLSEDATGALFQEDTQSVTTATANQYISEQSIHACEDACNALSVTETLLARATSLLHKFPGQYSLIQDLLRLKDGATVAVMDSSARRCVLDAIHRQQKQHMSLATGDTTPRPALREYILRNLDDERPAQLSVRFVDDTACHDSVEMEGGVLLALLKTNSD